MTRDRPSTIRDVAQAARVSPTTVSRFLNNNIALPPETTRRIETAIAKLNYRPNILARRLSQGRSEMLGLVTPDIANPFFAALASAVEEEAAPTGYSVILCSTQNLLERELSYLDRLAAKHIDGLIFLTNHGDDGSLRARINAQANIVVLDEDIPGTRVPKVFAENEQGGYAATRHLLDKGHRRIAHVSGPSNLFSVGERYAGYRRALSDAGVPLDRDLILFGAYTPKFGAEAVARLLAQPQPPTAIFAASDYIVVGILDGLRERRVRVPQDMSLIGFDDMAFAHLLDPPITTVHQPIAELGRIAVRLLIERIGNHVGRPAMHRLPVRLVERASVAPPRRTRP